MQRKKISIAIPASVVSDTPHLREKTSKVGLIGRAAAIFGVEEIIIYEDEKTLNQTADMDLVATLLNYMETPQYLRKKLFRLSPKLRYAGILPPLRTPHHPLGKTVADLKVGENREGVTVAKTSQGILVDIGVDTAALIPCADMPVGKRVTVKIVDVKKRVVASLSNREDISQYWGYKVTTFYGPFGKLAKERLFDLKIATSKYGALFTDVKDRISGGWAKANSILIAFGAPAKGLYEIAMQDGFDLSKIVDFVVNTIPGQSTETVRTEEAIIASLAVFNCIFRFKV